MCSYLAPRCYCDMWSIFDCIRLWAFTLPSSSFILSTFNDFRKSYFVITIINHIYLYHNHITSSIHIHLFIIHSTIFFWMRHGRRRKAFFLQNKTGLDKRLFLSWVSKSHHVASSELSSPVPKPLVPKPPRPYPNQVPIRSKTKRDWGWP